MACWSGAPDRRQGRGFTSNLWQLCMVSDVRPSGRVLATIRNHELTVIERTPSLSSCRSHCGTARWREISCERRRQAKLRVAVCLLYTQ